MSNVKNDYIIVRLLINDLNSDQILEFCKSFFSIQNNLFEADIFFPNIEKTVVCWDDFKEKLSDFDECKSIEIYELNDRKERSVKPKFYLSKFKSNFILVLNDFKFNESSIHIFNNIYFADFNYYPHYSLERSNENDWTYYLPEIPSFLPKPSDDVYADNKKRCEFKEKLALHTHTIFDDSILWVHVAPVMIVSDLYFKYFPKFLWISLTDCEAIETINNNLIKITIFSNVKASILEENYTKLWSVRKQLGMDTITHEICEPVKHLNWIDPDLPVYITLKTEKGGFTRVTRYFDKNGKLSSKSQAKSLEIKEFLEDGITCVFEETKQKGLFGWK